MKEPISDTGALDRGRAAFDAHAWTTAFAELSAAAQGAPLAAQDVERLAIAAQLLGKDAECIDLWIRAHNDFVRDGEIQRAVRCTFWLGFSLNFWGEPARGGGWLTRGQRLLDETGLDCAECGYLLIPRALQLLQSGDPQAANDLFREAVRIGERFREPDLLAIGRLGTGQSLVHLGETARGLALLDEAMATVTSGEVSPLAVGMVYCAVISCCQELFDVGRAQEWTAAFARWLESQPDLVPYRGDCLVYRVEIMQLRGAWPSALEEAQRACESLPRGGDKGWIGAAHYRQGELHRLRGEYTKAEEAYREANQHGHDAQPGQALLRLAQGRKDAAVASVTRALAESQGGVGRSRLLPAYVEILLAAGEVPAAREAAEELSAIAATWEAPLLKAFADQATGAVLLAEGDVRGALRSLRAAWNAWYALEAPYEAARTRVLIAQACRRLDDVESADMELDAARQIFVQLAAAPDLARLEPGSRGQGGLSAREVEVLRLVAAGKTNRAIATDLVLSEKTVARHVSNIFGKLGISSRSAATAYAYEHDLL